MLNCVGFNIDTFNICKINYNFQEVKTMLYSNIIEGRRVKMTNGKVGRVMQKHGMSGDIYICFELNKFGRKQAPDGWYRPSRIKGHLPG